MSCLIHLHHTTLTSNQTTVTVAITAALSASQAESSVDSANHLVEKTYPPRHSSHQYHPTWSLYFRKDQIKTLVLFVLILIIFLPVHLVTDPGTIDYLSSPRQLPSVTPATYINSRPFSLVNASSPLTSPRILKEGVVLLKHIRSHHKALSDVDP